MLDKELLEYSVTRRTKEYPFYVAMVHKPKSKNGRHGFTGWLYKIAADGVWHTEVFNQAKTFKSIEKFLLYLNKYDASILKGCEFVLYSLDESGLIEISKTQR